MKKTYEQPRFFAEAYTFSSSIAMCAYETDPNTPVTISLGTNLCTVRDNGHAYSEKSEAYKVSNGLNPVTIFNDGDSLGCYFDWAGPGTNVTQTGHSFAQTFYSNSATPQNHAPGYEGAAFFS